VAAIGAWVVVVGAALDRLALVGAEDAVVCLAAEEAASSESR
jgi:hypothetical protein